MEKAKQRFLVVYVALLTCTNFAHILPAAALHNPPQGPLEDVQEVVVDPEPHKHLHWKP
jgi:hypothetical protein